MYSLCLKRKNYGDGLLNILKISNCVHGSITPSCLWQGRFGSVVMDEEHLANAVRYVSLNPVRARLVERVQEWPGLGSDKWIGKLEKLAARQLKPQKHGPNRKTRDDN